ncbi:MAG: type IX secretion system sortase PorU, partial [Bacteroidota bacterium]
ENLNLHMHQAEELAGIVATKYPVFNVNKIYLDSYQLIQVPQGSRFPDVNKAINHAVAKGCLILNYTGHGGEDGWAGEKALTIADIKGWKNFEKLPVFITATCEFSRFDNPERYTAGEMVLMQPDGGAIALYSTTRLALSTSNFRLDSSFFMNMIPDSAGAVIPKMGDLIRISKNNNGNNNNIRNFVLLGDPAQEIAYPKYFIKTTQINEGPVRATADTALGLSLVKVKGEVNDNLGNKISGYNGTLFPKVYDKPTVETTLGNTSDSYPEKFEALKTILYEGKSTISKGEFEFSFVIPKSISLQFGKGKISYYAKDSVSDAWGFYNNIVIGGNDPTINPVNPGPDFSLYMNNTAFKNGDMTNNHPDLLAFINDPNGVNFTGVGIGHEIIAYLDEDMVHPIILNDYFTPDMDQYTGGKVLYPMQNLANGRHTIRVKAWDFYNNPAEKSIFFFVSEIPESGVQQVMNFPNPVMDHTTFQFVSTQNRGKLNVKIEIANQIGRIVKTLSATFPDGGGPTVTIPWNGTGEGGARLSAGLYVYRLQVNRENGTFFQASQKLVIGAQ